MIDWTVSTDLYRDVGEDAFEKIMTVMQQEAAERLTSLGAPERDLHYDLYMLKGLSLNMGFKDMTTLCETDGTALAANANLPQHIDKIRACFDASNQMLTAHTQQARAS